MSRVLVTGAANGIGRALTGALAAAGHRVVAADVSLDGLALAQEKDAWPDDVVLAFLDVTSDADWEACLDLAEERLGGIDVLCNVAGVLAPAYVRDLTARECDQHLAVNVKGVALGTAAAARRFVAAGVRGHVVNIGSLASLTPVPGLSLYCASKWAVRGFSLSAAVELREHGVAVSLVCPDAVQTPMLELQKDRAEAALTFSGDRPLTVGEVCDVILKRVLPKRPLEVTIPTGRGLLARAGGIAPGLTATLYPLMKERGRSGQRRARGS